MYGEVLYLEFYSVLSESYSNHELLLLKDCNLTSSSENIILHTLKEQWIANGKQILLAGYAVGILKINGIEVSVVKSYGTMLYPYIWL